MREFFQGWRRKTGVVALVMACGLMGMWMRSRVIRDEVRIRKDDQNFYFFHSNQSQLSWARIREQHPFQFTFNTIHFAADSDGRDLFNSDAFKWHWQACGFEFGEYSYLGTDIDIEFWRVSYWSLAIPLTLLSGYLLLWKPQTRESEPVKKGASG